MQRVLFICQFSNCLFLGLQVKWFPKPIFNRSKARKHFSFGWKLLVSGLLDQGYQSLSDLIIGKQFSASDLGLVSQGKKYPQALGGMLDGAIQPVMLSAISRVQADSDVVGEILHYFEGVGVAFLVILDEAFDGDVF